MKLISKIVIVVLSVAGFPAAMALAGASVNYEYDKNGNCTAITKRAADGAVLEKTTYTYDAYRRCTSMTEAAQSSQSRTWKWHYDRYSDSTGLRDASTHTSKQWRVQVAPAFNAENDRSLTARKFDFNDRIVEEITGMIEKENGDWVTGPDTEIHFFSYDANGNKKTYTDPRGRLTTYEHDRRDRLTKTTEPLSRVTETVYDTTGNKTDVTFPDARSQHWRDYDPFGQAWTFIDERNNPTKLTYQWGPMKKLHTVTTHRDGVTADLPTRFEYDGMGRPAWTYFPDNSTERTTYQFGQVKEFKTRKNQTRRISYDARGREISHTWDIEAATGVEAAPGISRSWDDANRVLTLCNIYSTIDYGYDDSGLVLAEKNLIAGSGSQQQTTFHRYGDGRVSAIQYPNGLWVYRDYTARGQLKTVEDSVSGPVIDYTYLPDGKVKDQVYGNETTTTTFGYDGRGMISSVSHKKGADGPVLSSREYTRDNRDRITSLTKENGRGDRFRYDEEGQLKEAWYNAANPASSGEGNTRYDGFNYDALGNRIGTGYVANRGQMEFTQKANGLNQYRAWMPFSIINYDDDIAGWGAPAAANGVLMQDGNITAGFNALNQPTSIWSATAGWINFGYDPLGRPVKRWSDSAGATYLYYEGWNLIQEGPSAASASRLYIHGSRVDEIVKQITPSNGWARFFHYDARGHATLQTDASGNIAEQYEYDAFGQPYFYDGAGQPMTVNGQPGSIWGNRFLFTGREYLSELKLYDYRHRMYQPELGRFLQPDPKHFAAGDYNLYRYCHNDPVNKSDPTGLDPSAAKWHLQAGPIDIQKIGNWGDRSSADYYKEGIMVKGSPAEGGTFHKLTELAARPDGGVTGKLSVNTHVLPRHKGTLVDTREQDHPNGFKSFLKTLSDKVLIQMVKDPNNYDSMKKFSEERKNYVQKLYEAEVANQARWDRKGGRHDYSRPEFHKK